MQSRVLPLNNPLMFHWFKKKLPCVNLSRERSVVVVTNWNSLGGDYKNLSCLKFQPEALIVSLKLLVD